MKAVSASWQVEPRVPVFLGVSPGITSLLARGWQLCYRHARLVSLTIFIPTVLYTVAAVLGGLPASLYGAELSNLDPSASQLFLVLLSFGGTILLGVMGSLLMLLTNSVLVRQFYQSLLRQEGESIPLTASLRDLLRHWWFHVKHVGLKLLLMGAFLWIVSAALSIIDLVLFASGIFASAGMIAVGVSQTLVPLKFGAWLLAILIGAGTVLGLCVMITIQMLMVFFPLIAISISDGKQVWEKTREALLLLRFNWLQSTQFALMLMLIYAVFSLILQAPLLLWIAFELFQLHLHQALPDPSSLPLHVTVVSQCWSSLVSGFLVVFATGQMTLFYYNCQAKSLGLDLAQRLVYLAPHTTSAKEV